MKTNSLEYSEDAVFVVTNNNLLQISNPIVQVVEQLIIEEWDDGPSKVEMVNPGEATPPNQRTESETSNPFLDKDGESQNV